MKKTEFLSSKEIRECDPHAILMESIKSHCNDSNLRVLKQHPEILAQIPDNLNDGFNIQSIDQLVKSIDKMSDEFKDSPQNPTTQSTIQELHAITEFLAKAITRKLEEELEAEKFSITSGFRKNAIRIFVVGAIGLLTAGGIVGKNTSPHTPPENKSCTTAQRPPATPTATAQPHAVTKQLLDDDTLKLSPDVELSKTKGNYLATAIQLAEQRNRLLTLEEIQYLLENNEEFKDYVKQGIAENTESQSFTIWGYGSEGEYGKTIVFTMDLEGDISAKGSLRNWDEELPYFYTSKKEAENSNAPEITMQEANTWENASQMGELPSIEYVSENLDAIVAKQSEFWINIPGHVATINNGAIKILEYKDPDVKFPYFSQE